MAVKRIEFELIGKPQSLNRALDETAAHASTSAKHMEDGFSKSSSKIGGLFHGLASAAGSVFPPLEGAINKVADKFDKAEGKAGGFGKNLAAIGGLGAGAGIAGLVAIG